MLATEGTLWPLQEWYRLPPDSLPGCNITIVVVRLEHALINLLGCLLSHTSWPILAAADCARSTRAHRQADYFSTTHKRCRVFPVERCLWKCAKCYHRVNYAKSGKVGQHLADSNVWMSRCNFICPHVHHSSSRHRHRNSERMIIDSSSTRKWTVMYLYKFVMRKDFMISFGYIIASIK